MKNIQKQLTLKDDFIFKRLFSKKGNEELLIDFLESILEIKIQKIEVIPEAEIGQRFEEDKYGALDLKATLNDGIIANIEMQVKDEKNIEDRTIYYASRVMSDQLKITEKYDNIKDVIMINILNFNYIDLPEYHTETVTVAKKHRNYEMLKKIKYHFIELPKFRNAKPDMNNKLEQWLVLIDGINRELIEMAKQKNEKIKKASDEWEYLKGDEAIKRIEFLKFKGQLDYNSSMADAEERGMERGIKQEKIEIAKNLLKDNVPINLIVKYTGLTEKEVQDLKEELDS